MIRNHDSTGVSGIGKVLEGVEFSNKFVITHWFGKFESINTYKDFDSFLAIHVRSHPDNGTEVIWSDGTIEKY